MYLPDLFLLHTINSFPVLTSFTPADLSHFTLSIVGVLGLFGGDEATFAIATVLIHKHRRWLGWYNTPGSYQIARKYGLAAMSTIFQELFPGASTHPANVFEPDGRQRPRFRAVHSGTVQDSTGHLASLLMKQCASLAIESDGVSVSIATLKYSPPKEVDLHFFSAYSFFAIIPIICSAIACIGCGFIGDWYSFASILLGMISNGIFSFVIGTGTIRFTHQIPAAGSPPGDGLLGSGNDFVLLRGEEGAVNSITGGKLSLKFPGNSDGSYIGYCSILFVVQFIAQLVLIPQATLLGQLIFVCSLAVSWVYNLWSLVCEKENIQSHILMEEVFKKEIALKKEPLPRRTNAAVFALCVLFLNRQAKGKNGSLASPATPISAGSSAQSASPNPHLLPLSPSLSSDGHDPHRREVASKILDAYLPNDTKVWKKWKEAVLDQLCTTGTLHFGQRDIIGLKGYTDDERNLLQTLHTYAQDAYDHYNNCNLD